LQKQEKKNLTILLQQGTDRKRRGLEEEKLQEASGMAAGWMRPWQIEWFAWWQIGSKPRMVAEGGSGFQKDSVDRTCRKIKPANKNRKSTIKSTTIKIKQK
jgi:hypothetical protein